MTTVTLICVKISYVLSLWSGLIIFYKVLCAVVPSTPPPPKVMADAVKAIYLLTDSRSVDYWYARHILTREEMFKRLMTKVELQ